MKKVTLQGRSATEKGEEHRNWVVIRRIIRRRLREQFEESVTTFHSVDFLVTLLRRGEVRVSLETMANHYALSISTTRRMIRRLQHAKLIEVCRTAASSGAQLSNRYRKSDGLQNLIHESTRSSECRSPNRPPVKHQIS